MPANGINAYTFTFTCGTDGSSAQIEDVLFGDVYFFFGQSNCEFTTNDAFNATAEVQSANLYPYIRVTSGPEQGVYNLNTLGNHSYDLLQAQNLQWAVANNVTVGCPGCQGWNYLSALGFFTVRELYDQLNGGKPSSEIVPIGCIVQSYGGTSIQWWSSPAAIQQCNAPPGSACCNYGGIDSCLWNAQVTPYLRVQGGYKLSGLVYYQGEQNAGCGGVPQIDYYYCALPALIADYRASFQQPNLPFGAVLLAAWQSSTPYFPQIRLSVLNTVSNVPNTFAISAIDRGDPAGGPVHSPYKQDVGKRAALGMLALVYNETATTYRGPRAVSATASLPTSVAIAFDPVSLYGQPLQMNASVACPSTITAASCEAFAVQTSDCTWWSNVTATVTGAQGNTLTLSLPAGAPTGLTAVSTRGYYANWPVVQVNNAAGLPAEPWVLNVTGVANPCPGILGREAAGHGRVLAARIGVLSEMGMDMDIYG